MNKLDEMIILIKYKREQLVKLDGKEYISVYIQYRTIEINFFREISDQLTLNKHMTLEERFNVLSLLKSKILSLWYNSNYNLKNPSVNYGAHIHRKILDEMNYIDRLIKYKLIEKELINSL